MARFPVLPEHADAWPRIVADFTAAVRAEPGCLWFDWSRNLEDASEYVLLEAFADDDAAAAHVGSEHFSAAAAALPRYLSATPRVINTTADGSGWSLLGEMAVDER